MSDKNKRPGVLKRIASNRDIKLGILFLALALVFAFASIDQDLESYQNNEELVRGQKGILDRKYEERSAELSIKYDSDGSSEEAVVHIENSDFDKITSFTMDPNDNITIDLHENEGFEKYVWANFTSGDVEYTFQVTYTVQPYSLLTFPAMFFTLLGVVFSLKGKTALMEVIGKEKKMDKMREEMGERMKDSDDEEMSRLEKSRKEQGLQRRSGDVRTDIKFMGVDFKGQEKEEDEE